MKKIILNVGLLLTLILLACFMTSCKKKVNTYTVTFMDGDIVLKTETVNEGEDAEGLIPSKEGYIFEGWSVSINNINSDVVTYASFSPIQYDVKFMVDGEIYATKTVEYNGTVIPPVRPEKEGHIFMGWDGSYKNVTSNLEINAKFEKIEYEVIFYDFNGNEIDKQYVK